MYRKIPLWHLSIEWCSEEERRALSTDIFRAPRSPSVQNNLRFAFIIIIIFLQIEKVRIALAGVGQTPDRGPVEEFAQSLG